MHELRFSCVSIFPTFLTTLSERRPMSSHTLFQMTFRIRYYDCSFTNGPRGPHSWGPFFIPKI